jgi:hypothetical protein
MSKDIREILESLGVEWSTGYMKCPVCQEQKLTASLKKSVATCWKCGKQWWPGNNKRKAASSWGVSLMNSVAEPCRSYLPESIRTLDWLVKVRKLPNDPHWLQMNSVGAHPGKLELAPIIAKAKKALDENREQALALTADEDEFNKVLGFYKEEKGKFEEFVKDTLTPMFAEDHMKGSVVFIYENSHEECLSLNIRSFWREEDKKKACQRLQPIAGRRGVFCPFIYNGSYWDDTAMNTLILEGEVNWLQLRAQTKRWGKVAGRDVDYYHQSGMAVGGKNGADTQTIQQFLDNYPPTIIYDNDTKDDDTGIPQGYDLVDAINWKTPCYAVTTRTKDMDDYVMAWNPKPEDIKNLINSAEYLPRPFESVKKDIDKVTAQKGKERFLNREVTEIVLNDMQQRGTFYNVSYGVFVWEQKKKNKLVEIRKGHPTWTGFLSNYGIQPGEKLADIVGKNIGVKTEDPSFAPKNRIRILFQFASSNLYINEYAGTVIRIDKNGNISRICNGEDGVLFHQYDVGSQRDVKFLDMTPFKVDIAKAQQVKAGLKVQPGELLDEYILGTVNYNSFSMAEATAKQFLKTYIISIFFADQFKTKVFPVFDGAAGAGKNSIGHFLGLLLTGERFSVLSMPDKPDALAENMIDVPFACFDEWDSSNAAVEKKLKSLATNAFEKRRELYTTFNTITMECQAAVMLSTNANPAKKAATSQRLLLFDVNPRQKNRRDKDFESLGMVLQPEFMEHRDEIWTELVGTLANVVRTFWDMELLPTHFRMADFGSFMSSVATVEGWGDDADRMLSEMQDRQITLAVEKSIVANLLRELFANTTHYQGVFRTAKEWAGILHTYVEDNDHEVKNKITASYLGHVFAVQETILKETYSMKKEEDAKNGHRYAFWPQGYSAESPAPEKKLKDDMSEYEDVMDKVFAKIPLPPHDRAKLN